MKKQTKMEADIKLSQDVNADTAQIGSVRWRLAFD